MRQIAKKKTPSLSRVLKMPVRIEAFHFVRHGITERMKAAASNTVDIVKLR